MATESYVSPQILFAVEAHYRTAMSYETKICVAHTEKQKRTLYFLNNCIDTVYTVANKKGFLFSVLL